MDSMFGRALICMALSAGHASAYSPDHGLLIFAGKTTDEITDAETDIEAAFDDACHKVTIAQALIGKQ